MPNIKELFENLNQQYFSRTLQRTFGDLKGEFGAPANEYFTLNRATSDHNWFFEQFTPIWLDQINDRRYFNAILTLDFAISLALDWEKQNRPNKVHKGTPYYFLGVTGILNNELDNGFLAMHQAVQEDKRLSGRRLPEAPAFWFVTLDYTRQGQFFREKVEQIANYLSERLVEYSTTRGGSLTLDQFRAKFLRRRRLMEEVFLFVYSIFKLRKLAVETSKIYKKNVFSSILHAKLLFDLSIITDKVIEYKNPRKGQKLTFADELIFLSSRPRRLLSFNVGNKIGKLRDDFHDDFSGTIYNLLKRRYSVALSDIENDFAITYGVRNFGAHKIENQSCLYNNMPKLAQKILNSLFYTVDKIY